MEKHFCDLETCGKEITTYHELRLWSNNAKMQERYNLNLEFIREAGSYGKMEFCSEDCLIEYAANKIKDIRAYLNGLGVQFKSLEVRIY